MPNEASCKDIGCACMIEPSQLSLLAAMEDFQFSFAVAVVIAG